MRTNSSKAPATGSDEKILAAAEQILRSRLDRLGKIAEPSAAGSYLRAHCAHSEREVFGCMYLDTQKRILSVDDLFFGTIDGAEVHPREVVRRGLLVNAAAVICYHNHPSGNLEPSAADRALTAQLNKHWRSSTSACWTTSW